MSLFSQGDVNFDFSDGSIIQGGFGISGRGIMRLLDNAVARHYLHYELFLLPMRLSNSEKVSTKKS